MTDIDRLTQRIKELEAENTQLLIYKNMAAEHGLSVFADLAEPVGVVGSMPGTTGFTMCCFNAADVPTGTKLFTRPSIQTSVWLPIDTAPRDEKIVVIAFGVKLGPRTVLYSSGPYCVLRYKGKFTGGRMNSNQPIGHLYQKQKANMTKFEEAVELWHIGHPANDAIEAAKEAIKELTIERDAAIAHDKEAVRCRNEAIRDNNETRISLTEKVEQLKDENERLTRAWTAMQKSKAAVVEGERELFEQVAVFAKQISMMRGYLQSSDILGYVVAIRSALNLPDIATPMINMMTTAGMRIAANIAASHSSDPWKHDAAAAHVCDMVSASIAKSIRETADKREQV